MGAPEQSTTRFIGQRTVKNGISYHHKNCYKNVTHGHAVDRARARFEKGTSSGDVTTILTKKKGRPSSCDSTLTACSTASQRHTREQCYQKHKCVFCQDDTGSKLHDVSYKNMGTQIKTIGLETINEGLRVRLSNVACSSDPLQSVADDMKYHLPCLVNAKRDVDQSKQPQSATVNFGQLLSDRQLLEIVETELNDSRLSSKDVVMNMNDIHQMCIELLDENELPVPDNPRYKLYMKQLILDNIPDVQFSRHPDKTKPEQILSTRSKDRLIASGVSADVLKEDLKVLLRAAKILRRDIATSSSWQFTVPLMIMNRQHCSRPFVSKPFREQEDLKSRDREQSVNQSASVLAQHFVWAYRSNRQVSYNTINANGAFR